MSSGGGRGPPPGGGGPPVRVRCRCRQFRQACFGAVHHGERHQSVQSRHRAWCQGPEQLVPCEGLLPVRVLGARGTRVAGGDRGPELVRAHRGRQGRRDQRVALGDAFPVPPLCGPARRAAPVRRRGWCGAGRRASVRSMSASNPATSPSSGRRVRSWRVRRIASVVRSVRCRESPGVSAGCSTAGTASACRRRRTPRRARVVPTTPSKGQLNLEQHGGRTIEGVGVRTAQRLLALTAAIWHNRAAGQPITRSLTAYDH